MIVSVDRVAKWPSADAILRGLAIENATKNAHVRHCRLRVKLFKMKWYDGPEHRLDRFRSIVGSLAQ